MGELLERWVLPACRGAGFWVLYDAGQEVAVLPVQLGDALVMVLVRADDARQQVQLSAPGLLTVPPGQREAMALAISRWNFQHLPMLLAMDPADGEVRAALLVDLQSAADAELAVADNLTRLVSTLEQAYPALARLRWGSGRKRPGKPKVGEVERQIAEILQRAGELPDLPDDTALPW